jgi:uncharacterized protein (DUF2141 family)
MNLFLSLISLIILNQSSTSYDLTINVKGFPSSKGEAYIAIYRATDDFPVFGKQYKGKTTTISGNASQVVFSGIPSGSYAVAVYHDKNNNNVLDKNYLGIPTESYGFSNNARRTFSAPSFSEAAVVVNNSKTINITVK